MSKWLIEWLLAGMTNWLIEKGVNNSIIDRMTMI